jgi:hypothetical protein
MLYYILYLTQLIQVLNYRIVYYNSIYNRSIETSLNKNDFQLILAKLLNTSILLKEIYISFFYMNIKNIE